MEHLFLTSEFKPVIGGIAEYLHGLAGGLSDEGEDVFVHCFGVDEDISFAPSYTVRYGGGIPQRMPGERWGDGFPPTRKMNSALCALRRVAHGWRTAGTVLSQYDSDGLRIYVGVWNEEANGWCRRLRKESVSYRLFAHGREVVRSLDPVRGRWRRTDFEAAERVYACSRATASRVRERFGEVPVLTVHPGVSPPPYREKIESEAARLRAELGIEERESVLLTVGRLIERKGVGTVLDALDADALAERSVRYLVAGEGPQEGELREKARNLGLQDRVVFLGRVSERTKWALYRLSDVFVMPNSTVSGRDWEGFGIVFLEAAVMGVPAIGGSSGGAREAIVDDRTGYLVEPDSPSRLVEALLRLLEDPELCRRLGSSARGRVRREFTWSQAARRLLAGD